MFSDPTTARLKPCPDTTLTLARLRPCPDITLTSARLRPCPLSKMVARVVGSAWMVRNSRLAGESACPTLLVRRAAIMATFLFAGELSFITRLIQS